MSELISIERDQSVALVTINNPPVNIVDSAVLSELLSTLNLLEADPLCRALILTGGGEKGFSAGASVEEHLPTAAPQMIGQMTEILERLLESPLVTLAAVHGICLGGGAELALGCDFVIASNDTKIGIPEITLGCYPPFAMVQLPDLVGIRKAKEMVLSGRAISADEALQFGLVNSVVSRKELQGACRNLLTPILKNSPRIVALTLSRLRSLQTLVNDAGHKKMGGAFLSDLMTHPDYNEGMNSFLEKRKPNWKGKRFCDGGCHK